MSTQEDRDRVADMKSRYAYKENSNLVTHGNNEPDSRGPKDEATGEVHSLVGKIDTMRMGDRVSRSTTKAALAISNNLEVKQARSRQGYYKSDVVSKQAYAGAYQPKSNETRSSYDGFLSYIALAIGDQPPEVLAGAAEEVLITLKNPKIHDKKRREEVEELLGALDSTRYQALMNLSRRLTDFNLGQEEEEDLETMKMRKQEEEEYGINVELDDEDDDIVANAGLEQGISRYAIDIQNEDNDPDLANQETISTAKSSSDKASGQTKFDPRDVDAYWVQRQIAKFTDDPHLAQTRGERVLTILEEELGDPANVENRIMSIVDYQNFEFVRLIRDNATEIYWCTKLARADDATKNQIRVEMHKQPELKEILNRLESTKADLDEDAAGGKKEAEGTVKTEDSSVLMKRRTMLDLDGMSFENGSHLMANKECMLPDGTERTTRVGYELVKVPARAAEAPNPSELIPIKELPLYAQAAFEGYKSLNRIQSRIAETALKTDENMLICAPTGAGKTNVALLAMLREIGKHINRDGTINKDDFKIIYISPMRSLVQEQTGSFSGRLESYGIKVAELTGDNQLCREEIEATQLIICTPEKWDIVTRKGAERSYTNLVRLIIIDEVHLLHDDRGPVLEAIVARTLRAINQFGAEPVRIVGLSATLPNYEDVASFLHVDRRKGLFHFDNSFRPVPLQTNFVGVTERKALKKFAVMNEVVYENVVKHAGKHQVLVFVHSRKETAKTAKALRDMCLDRDTLGMFIKEGSHTTEILRTEAEDTATNMDLKEVMPYGFGIHHAGLSRIDRSVVEDLFADGIIQVLVSTATLAWGVNLPAHSVIIKGTKVYSPDKGRWTELSALDVLQMLGRAGRPQYDTLGEGTLITENSELQYYLSLMHEQLPIESQMVAKLPDLLCAEVVLGNVTNVTEAADWLSYTYLYVRMLKKPGLYGINGDIQQNDTPTLTKFRSDLIHTAAAQLDKNQLIRYDRASGQLQSTELGRIASNYYITYKSMATYTQMLRPHLSEIELLRVFALSYEFRNVSVRDEEKLELAKLHERVPIPIKESIEEPSSKINCLLQAYISQLSLDGFALTADMVYVKQSAARIIRALYEIVLSRGWCQLANKLLNLSKMVQKRMWQSMCPLRQFTFKQQDEVVKRIEKKNFDFERFYDLTPVEISELLRMQKMGKVVHKYLHQIPKFDLSVHIQPITRSSLRVELSLTPDFQWNDAVHNRSEGFWIFVEDVDSEKLLHHEFFILHQRYANDDHVINFFVPVFEPLPPQYFVRVISDRWIGSETSLAVSFRHLILPEKYLPPTELLDLQPYPVKALRNDDFESVFKSRFPYFNPVQTQTFQTLYTTDESCFIGAPGGTGKTVCAELAIMRMLTKFEHENQSVKFGRCVYISPRDDTVKKQYEQLERTFGKQLNKRVVMLSGNTAADLKLIAKANVIVTTAEKWDILSRRWKQRKHIQRIDLFICDDIHLIGDQIGPTMEIICSRARYVAQQLDRELRIVALGNSIANGKDIAQWLGVKSSGTYNFHPNARPLPLDLHIQGYSLAHAEARILSMQRATFNAVTADDRASSLVFVPSRRHAKLIALELMTIKVRKDEEENRKKKERLKASGNMEDDDFDDTHEQVRGFLDVDRAELASYLKHISDATLAECLNFGVGFLHEGSSDVEKKIVQQLYQAGAIKVLVASRALCWSLEARAKVVVIMDTQDYNGRTHTYQDYPITDVLAMIGRCGRPLEDRTSKAFIFCQMNKKEMFKKFVYEPLPVESHLDHCLHDHFNAEIVTKTIENNQDALDYLTWTLLYRRMCQNPNYYNMHGSTHRHLSDSLSELVENTLSDLVNSKCIAIEEDQEHSITPLNLGMIAAYYYISYTTLELFSMSLHIKTKTRGLLEILSAASEFEDIKIRNTDVVLLEQLNSRVPYRPAAAGQQIKFYDPHVKTHILLQSHMSRLELPAELQQDNDFNILPIALRLVQASIDVMSSNGWLTAALSAMDLTQMLTQACWARDGYLRQVPHFSQDLVDKAKKSFKVESVFDLLEMDDDERLELLGVLTERQMGDVAKFCNNYPNVELNFQTEDPEEIEPEDDVDDEDEETPAAKKLRLQHEAEHGKPIKKRNFDCNVKVALSRDDEDAEISTEVVAPFWPAKREQGWWVLVGNQESNHLVCIKRVQFSKQTQISLNWQVDDNKGPEKRKYTLYLVSDCYTGCDQEYEFELEFK